MSEQERIFPRTVEELIDHLGEGIHTAFRKATDCEQAHPIWKLIQEMPAEDWTAVLKFVALLDCGVDYGLTAVVEQRNALEKRLAQADRWKQAILDAGVVHWTLTDENADDPEKLIQDTVQRIIMEAADPAISELAAKLQQAEGFKALADEVMGWGWHLRDNGYEVSCPICRSARTYAGKVPPVDIPHAQGCPKPAYDALSQTTGGK